MAPDGNAAVGTAARATKERAGFSMTPTAAGGIARGGAAKLAREVAAPQRRLLRIAGGLLVGGELLALVAGFFHPTSAHPNDHTVTFAKYAASDDWLAVHIGQFAGVIMVLAGLVVLYRALAQTRLVDTLALVAVSGAVATAALVALVNAVDGVMLKQAVDTWANTVGPNKVLAFHDAETARWLEWGANSFASLLEGVTIALFGLAIARTALVPRWLGWAAVIAGIDYLVVGALIGHDGFSDTVPAVSVTGDLLLLIVAIGIAVTAWRAPARDDEPAPAPPV
ncbi:MAG: hypothetical protein QOF28_1372 [Actinomycetota bacterium]|nr:hypothetical protein [Actinomycetota bacterium]